MRRSLPHEIGRLRPAAARRRRAAGSLARGGGPADRGRSDTSILYDAELPVVANNFGYGFLDSIRFFLAGTEEEALAIARRRQARWVVATDLVPRMNDYAVLPRQGPLS